MSVTAIREQAREKKKYREMEEGTVREGREKSEDTHLYRHIITVLPSSPRRIPRNSSKGRSPHLFESSPFLEPDLCDDSDECPRDEMDAADDDEGAKASKCDAANTPFW
jgi:hypothetical protein